MITIQREIEQLFMDGATLTDIRKLGYNYNTARRIKHELYFTDRIPSKGFGAFSCVFEYWLFFDGTPIHIHQISNKDYRKLLNLHFIRYLGRVKRRNGEIWHMIVYRLGKDNKKMKVFEKYLDEDTKKEILSLPIFATYPLVGKMMA